jgi:UDP-glucose 4-epimerase
LPVEQSLSSQVLAVERQYIECKEARRVPTMEQQVFELWSATSIEGADFAVDDGCPIRQAIRVIDSANAEKEANGCPFREIN